MGGGNGKQAYLIKKEKKHLKGETLKNKNKKWKQRS